MKRTKTPTSRARPPASPRANQRHRTRKDLLSAASRLLKEGDGRTPTMDDVAEAAMVSRATAYRYFPTVEALLVEAPIDGEVPEPAAIFADDDSTHPVERLDRAEAMLHDMSYRNETQLRLMLAASLDRAVKRAQNGDDGEVPLRQNRRTALIESALAPARRRFTDSAYRKLCASLALVFGTESMIVFKDVLGLEEKKARRTKSWAIRALVEAALNESQRR